MNIAENYVSFMLKSIRILDQQGYFLVEVNIKKKYNCNDRSGNYRFN